MTNFGGFPVDLVLLGMVAVFLVLRLRSVLGKRAGVEQTMAAPMPRPAAAPGGRVIDVKPEAAHDSQQATRALPPRESPVGQALARISAIDGAFSPTRFLAAAEDAFKLIVQAFARGDRAALRPLLTPSMFDLFEQAIAAREAEGLKHFSTVHSIRSANFEAADVTGTLAHVTLRFVSDQVSYTNDAAGQTVVGTEAVTEITDVWTFERELSSRDPAWRLSASHSG